MSEIPQAVLIERGLGLGAIGCEVELVKQGAFRDEKIETRYCENWIYRILELPKRSSVRSYLVIVSGMSSKPNVHGLQLKI